MDEKNKIDKKILLEQYKLYVEMADRISQRRQSANNYFISVNIFLFSFFSYLQYIKFNIGAFIIFSAGIIVCFVWYRLIKSYKGINSGKFKVIHEMEKNLSYQPYKIEWEKIGKGNDKKLYQPFTKIELYVPWVFSILYAIFILIILFSS
ncbi:MAG: hypothetical protein OXJ52_00945 [Oligoflexia bacterium]|nr:hypothetical protein [Oligoflexia bacterium]